MTELADLKGRHVLVVGGAGYLGSVLVPELLARGATVRVLDCFFYENTLAIEGFWERPGFSFVYGDLCDAGDRAKALDGITDVVLMASLVGDPISKKYPNLTRRVNEDGSKALARDAEARGIERFVFTSTCSNYGLRDTDEPATEEAELHPLSLYAETKVVFEKFLLGEMAGHDWVPVVLRISTAFGMSPRMRFDLTVNEFTYHLARGEDLDVYDKDTWRPYCHTRDIAKAVIAALTADRSLIAGEVFNVGCDENNFTKEMIIDEIRRHIDAKVRFVDKGGDRRNYRVSFAKIKKTLGFQPDVMVRDFIPELIRAVNSNLFLRADRLKSYYGNYYVRPPWDANDQW